MHETRHVCFVAIKARWAFLSGSTKKFGGAERQIQRLATWLASEPGFKVSVIVEDEGQPERETIAGVELVRLDQPPAGQGLIRRIHRNIASTWGLLRLIRGLSPALVVQRCAGVETGLAQKAARQCGAKFVYMMASDHECDPEWASGRRLPACLFRAGFRRADRVVVQQVDQQRRVEATYHRDSIILPSIYPFGDEPNCNGRGAIWVSRLHPLKQTTMFLELARRIPRQPFILIGPAASAQREYHDRIKREAEAVANVEFVDGVAPEDMTAYYRRAEVLVNTSQWEGMPNTFLEAADHGLAIASLQVDPGGILRDGVGFCAGGDFEALTRQVKEWLSNPEACIAQGRCGRSILAARHDMREVGPAFARMLRELT